MIDHESIVEYECEENDNFIRVRTFDDKLDEIQVSDALRKSWTVIGRPDLDRALSLANAHIISG